MLFHPPAAHGENSGESGNEDTCEDNVASAADHSKKKKKRNRKKKRKGGDSFVSEASVNDQSNFMDESADMGQSGSTNTRPGRKLDGSDFTPLKEKIDDTFFDD